jgi:methionyl-tRNA formyltransferase
MFQKKHCSHLSMAALGAYKRVAKTLKQERYTKDGSLIDFSLEEFREVANRTEGMPRQRTELTGADGEPIKIHSVNIDTLSKKEMEEFLSIYNKIVSTTEKENDS